jgi:TPR repeat protein
MVERKTLVGRLVAALTRWMDARWPDTNRPRRRKLILQWDYDQADLQPPEGEPDLDGLNEALRLLRTNETEAFGRLYRLAVAGSASAANAVGEAYQYGDGVEIDEVAAEHWYRRACDQGRRRALLNYGRLLWRQRRYTEAEQVFVKGEQVDWAPAIYWLAVVRTSRAPLSWLFRSRYLLERAAAAGSPGASGALAAILVLGAGGPGQVRRGFDLIQAYVDLTKAPVARTTPAGDTLH